MTGLQQFQITYSLHDIARAFVQFDSQMSDEDAWYYACLHAGVGLVYGQVLSKQNQEQLREHAEKSGLTHVQWKALP